MPSLANDIRHLARVWRANARAAVVREMEFRINFFSGVLRQVLWLIMFLLLIHVIFKNTTDLAGWTRPQVITLLALSRLIEGISDTFFNRNISALPSTIQDGTFDFYLTKPIPAQFHAAFHRFKFLDLGNVAIGIVLLSYAYSLQPALFSLSNWLLFGLLALLGITIYYSLLMTIVSLAFFLERFDAFVAISNLVSEPLTVPFDIFPRQARLALTFLLPLAFIVFIPAQAITGRLALWQVPAAISIAAIFLLLANLSWSIGLRRYSSASS